MIKKIVFLSIFVVLVISFSRNTASASHVEHCVLFGEYIQSIEESDDPYVFEFSISSSMSIGGYTDCKNYIDSVQKVSLSKNALLEGKNLNIGDKIFIEYYHVSDKGGTHSDAYSFIGFHDKSH